MLKILKKIYYELEIGEQLVAGSIIIFSGIVIWILLSMLLGDAVLYPYSQI
jgi:hypothetical protein